MPKERVRLAKQSVTEDETVSEQVGKEQVEVEGDAKGQAQAPQVESGQSP